MFLHHFHRQKGQFLHSQPDKAESSKISFFVPTCSQVMCRCGDMAHVYAEMQSVEREICCDLRATSGRCLLSDSRADPLHPDYSCVLSITAHTPTVSTLLLTSTSEKAKYRLQLNLKAFEHLKF